jgi:hypothetical protein
METADEPERVLGLLENEDDEEKKLEDVRMSNNAFS